MNKLIETWKKIATLMVNNKKLIYECMAYSNGNDYPLSKQIDDIRELASKQLKVLDEAKPDKAKMLYTQANEEQRQFIDYLELVIIYGKINITEKQLEKHSATTNWKIKNYGESKA